MFYEKMCVLSLSLSLLLIGSSITLNAQTLKVPGGTVGSSGNSNVGINVTTPNATLDVGGTTATGAFKITTTNATGMGEPGQEPIYTTPYALRVDFNETVYQPTGISTTALLESTGKLHLGNIASYSPAQFLNMPYQGLGIYRNGTDFLTLSYSNGAGINWVSTNQAAANKHFTFRYNNMPLMQLYTEGRLDVINTGTENEDLILSLQTGLGNVFRVSNAGSVFIGENLNGTHFDDYRLYVEKGIRTEKIRVDIAADNGWADFVFEDDYTLMPIAELEAYIKQHKHLPNVPSSEEVSKEGIDLAEMNAILLRQIEELTLRVIELEKWLEQIDEQKLLGEWILVGVKEGAEEYHDTNYLKTLEIKSNNQYAKVQRGKITEEGSWSLNDDAITFSSFSGEIDEFKIDSISNDELIIKILGRHGYVYFKYKKSDEK